MSFDGENKANGLMYVYIYGLFPFAGGILAVIFHEFVYRKITTAIVEQEQIEDDENTLDDFNEKPLLWNITYPLINFLFISHP